ncbi:unnamed protein product [Rotaria sp. Silwood1]|nr:unnamed protein product [Rotaria sp. Silwood1]
MKAGFMNMNSSDVEYNDDMQFIEKIRKRNVHISDDDFGAFEKYTKVVKPQGKDAVGRYGNEDPNRVMPSQEPVLDRSIRTSKKKFWSEFTTMSSELLPWTLAKQLHTLLPIQAIHYNIHGASECGIGLHYQVPRVDLNRIENKNNDQILVPSGRPGFGFRNYLVNENLQLITDSGQMGEILYGGETILKYLKLVRK